MTPADAVVFQGAAHAVIGHSAVLEPDAAPCAETRCEEQAELSRAAMGGMLSHGLAEVPVRLKGAHDRFGIAGVEGGLVSADNAVRVDVPWLQNGRSEVAPSIDRPLAAIGAKDHGAIIGRFGDDRHRPGQFLPVAGQVRQQLHHGPPADNGGGHGLDPGVALGQPGLIVADKPSQLPVAADLTSVWVVDHDLSRPHRLQNVGVTSVQCGEVQRDGISHTCGTSLPAGQFHRTSELRKPRHLNPWGPS